MLWQRGQAYAQDLRERVFATADTGLPVGRIAERFHVSISYVSKVLGRRRTTGETAARPQRYHIPRKLTGQFAAIQQQVQTHPDATIEELCTWLKETHKVSASATLEQFHPDWKIGTMRQTIIVENCRPRARFQSG